LVCRNASQAARDAGYSPKTAGAYARQVMNAPEVRAALAAAAQEAMGRAALDADAVIERIRGIAWDDDASAKDQLKALELLGKYFKLFVERVELSGKLTLDQLVTASEEPEDEPNVDPAP
jgi:hypothetical protein